MLEKYFMDSSTRVYSVYQQLHKRTGNSNTSRGTHHSNSRPRLQNSQRSRDCLESPRLPFSSEAHHLKTERSLNSRARLETELSGDMSNRFKSVYNRDHTPQISSRLREACKEEPSINVASGKFVYLRNLFEKQRETTQTKQRNEQKIGNVSRILSQIEPAE